MNFKKEDNKNYINISLVSDFYNLTYEKLNTAGYKVRKENHKTNHYFDSLLKRIPDRPRDFFCSKELIFPDEISKKAFSPFKSDAILGKSLVPYMSKRILKSNYNDILFNSWNIHHFHLETKKELKSEFKVRSDWLLFGYVDEKSVRAIKIYSHQDQMSWSESEVIKILFNNWPELFYKKNYFCNESHLNLNDKEHFLLRNNNVNYGLRLDSDKIYSPIGGGVMGDGSSCISIIQDLRYKKILKELEDIILNNQIELIDIIKNSTENHTEENLNIKLKEIDVFNIKMSVENVDVLIIYDVISGKLSIKNSK